MTRWDLRDIFGFHNLALAPVAYNEGFIIAAFVVWQGQDLEKEDERLLAIGIPSTTVLVGCQIYVAISVCVGLVHKLQSCDVSLIETWRAMRRRDMLLLIPGLPVLETEVVKHLPWGRSISTNVAIAD